MNEDHKKPGVAFWATVGLVVVALYVRSVGPAQQLAYNGWLTGSVLDFADAFYSPLDLVHRHGPDMIRVALDWYSRLWH